MIPAKLGTDCSANSGAYAAWYVRHSYYGPSGIAIFDGTSSTSNGFYDWEPKGTYYVEPGSAWDTNYNSLTQNTVSYVVKSGASLSLSSARAGSYVTLRAYNAYYNISTQTYRPWWGHTVRFQYKRCPTCAWTTLRAVNTAANGVATYRFVASKTLYYRAFAYSNASAWDAISSTVLR